MKIIRSIFKRTIAFIVIVTFLIGMIPVALVALIFLNKHKDYPRTNNAFNSLEGLVQDLYKWARA